MTLSATFNRPWCSTETSLQRFLSIPLPPFSPAWMSFKGKKSISVHLWKFRGGQVLVRSHTLHNMFIEVFKAFI